MKPRPAWRMPLESYLPLADPVTIRAVRKKERALAAVKAELEDAHGKPIYFPFGFSDRRACAHNRRTS